LVAMLAIAWPILPVPMMLMCVTRWGLPKTWWALSGKPGRRSPRPPGSRAAACFGEEHDEGYLTPMMYSSVIAPSFHFATVTKLTPPSALEITQVQSPAAILTECSSTLFAGTDAW
jgi:hypothetical protein